MGWANCGNDRRGRRIGYAVRATCDQKGCKTKIDRGLAFVCGNMHGEGNCLGGCGGSCGCGGYFCYAHLLMSERHAQLCGACMDETEKVVAA